MNVDIAVLQETKITNGIYTRNSSWYSIKRGGITLCWRESWLFESEETKFLSPHNVLTFRLITGGVTLLRRGSIHPTLFR